MKKLLRYLCCLCPLLMGVIASGETWYIRPDGGTRYSAQQTGGQCDGKADAAYPGHGAKRHCAFKDYRYLWDDQSYKSHTWVIAGGDTVIIRGGPWRVGWDAATGHDAGYTWCLGGDGNIGCFNPPIPSGTAEHHTRILGENFASCSTDGKTDRSKLTQIFGGYGVITALDLSNAKYVDVECLEITRHSQCILAGDPAYPGGCRRSTPFDDYDSDGIVTDTGTHDLLLQDLWIHGHPDRGIKGPIGGTVTCVRCDIAYNGLGGWDFDNGSSTPSINGVWNFRDSMIEWSGCNQEYPISHPIPVASCYGQSTQGYGDGVGTPAGGGITANIDHSSFLYNTQDGVDLGHVDKGEWSLMVSNSTFIGNNGGQLKWGPNMIHATVVNNLFLANCLRLSAPMPGAPTTYNAHLGDFCRAGDAIAFNFRHGGTVEFVNNTVVSYTPATFDVQCWDQAGSGSPFQGANGFSDCSAATLVFKNNIVLGYDNHATYDLGGKPGGPVLFYLRDKIGHIERSNNIIYGLRTARAQTIVGNEKLENPQFVSQPKFSAEKDLDNFNFNLSPSSPARGSGATLSNVRTDVNGKPRPSEGGYDMGAIQH